MLGTNRKATTMRLNAGKTEYVPYLSEVFQCRFEPKVYIKYDLKAKQVTFDFASDLMDVIVGDRIVVGERQWVAIRAMQFTEVLGKHLEVQMREIWPTQVHELCSLRKLDVVQSSYDPMLEEYAELRKEYVDYDLLAIFDPWEIARDSIIQMLDAGKIEELDFVMTVDFPTKIAKEDRIIYNWLEYKIKWVMPFTYQTYVWIKKSMDNYIANQD